MKFNILNFIFHLGICAFVLFSSSTQANIVNKSFRPADEDTCTGNVALNNTFKQCAAPFFNFFQTALPIEDETAFLVSLGFFIVLHETPETIIQLCELIEQMKKCTPIACWTPENFASIGLEAHANYYVTAFLTIDHLCIDPQFDSVVVNNTIPCVLSWAFSSGELMTCIDNLDINNISNIACSCMSTALTCLANTLVKHEQCPSSMARILCNALVFGGDQLLPRCSNQLNGSCVFTSPNDTTSTTINTHCSKDSPTTTTTTTWTGSTISGSNPTTTSLSSNPTTATSRSNPTTTSLSNNPTTTTQGNPIISSTSLNNNSTSTSNNTTTALTTAGNNTPTTTTPSSANSSSSPKLLMIFSIAFVIRKIFI